jgi:hypothetical protein
MDHWDTFLDSHMHRIADEKVQINVDADPEPLGLP